ncbi:MAG: hypothetical protein QXR65_09435 [Candidatus Bathyarchaeia archaeon]
MAEEPFSNVKSSHHVTFHPLHVRAYLFFEDGSEGFLPGSIEVPGRFVGIGKVGI